MLLDFIRLERTSSETLYLQLYRAVRDAVSDGRMAAGERMPSIRRLSEDLDISKTTVETAYNQLITEGYLEARPQKGCYVANLTPFSVRKNLEIKRTVRADAPKPLRYRFSTAAVDANAFPVGLWQKHLREVLARSDEITSYGDSQGEPELRAALAEYAYSVRGVRADPRQIVVGAGLQPLLYLLSGMLRDRERLIGLESPGFAQAERVLTDCGLSVCHLPSDADGVEAETVRDAGLRVLYLTPSNRLGGGIPMPMARRTALLEWAHDTDGLIVEDDHNGELRWHGRPIPALQGFDDGRHVVYIGTFSKVLLPSVRLGYMVLPAPLAEQYYTRAHAYHQTASKIEQLALASYIRRGEMEKQLRRLRKIYAAKGDRLIRCLRDTFGDRADIEPQETALRLLVTLHDPRSAKQLRDDAAAYQVEVTPFPAYEGHSRVLLGFSGIALDDIPEAVRRLGKAWLST